MKVSCITCHREINLDHVIFDNYEGPVKCFSCGTMMEIKTAQGTVGNVAFLGDTGIYANKTGSIGGAAA